MISLKEFLALPMEEVARLVRAAGSQVCVFPNDGTRRWYALEHAGKAGEDPFTAYLEASGHRHVELYRLFFEHGIDTLLAPIFGGDTFKRGEAYMQKVALDGLRRVAEAAEFVRFYDEYHVRVSFYGEYRKALAGIPQADALMAAFEAVSARTRLYAGHRLFYGVFAGEAAGSLAEMAVRSFQETGRVPDQRRMVELYYGEFIEPVSFFIGFEKFCAYDYPLLSTGMEDLYFMVAPSSYLGEKTLREILYDHLYTRRVPDPDYQSVPPGDRHWWKEFYTANQEVVLGTGTLKAGIWVPNQAKNLPE
jgi:adenosine tuberculosinyltransferase